MKTLMKLPNYRVRTLMMAVVMVALLMWGTRLGWRAFQYDQTFRYCSQQERGWRSIAGRRQAELAIVGKADPAMAKFAAECAEYYAGLTQKYDQARWRPWMKVPPDPPAPGAELAAGEEQTQALLTP